jgi:hypothetical protein
VHERVARIERPPLQQGLEPAELLRVQPGTQPVAVQRDAIVRAIGAEYLVQHRLLEPLEREIRVGEDRRGRPVARCELDPERRMVAGVDEPEVQALLREHVAEVGEEGRRDGIDLPRAPQVDDDAADLAGVLDDRPHDRLDRREEQVALQLHDLRAPARGGEGVELVRRAAPARRHRRHVVAPADRGAVRARRVQEVQRQVAGHPPADLDAARAVAVHVQRGREHGETQLAGEHREHASGDARVLLVQALEVVLHR